jgi:hypothetical protein
MNRPNTFTAEARRARKTAEEYKAFSAVLRTSAVNELALQFASQPR